MHRNTNEYKQKIQTQINMYISKVTMYVSIQKGNVKIQIIDYCF